MLSLKQISKQGTRSYNNAEELQKRINIFGNVFLDAMNKYEPVNYLPGVISASSRLHSFLENYDTDTNPYLQYVSDKLPDFVDEVRSWKSGEVNPNYDSFKELWEKMIYGMNSVLDKNSDHLKTVDINKEIPPSYRMEYFRKNSVDNYIPDLHKDSLKMHERINDFAENIRKNIHPSLLKNENVKTFFQTYKKLNKAVLSILDITKQDKTVNYDKYEVASLYFDYINKDLQLPQNFMNWFSMGYDIINKNARLHKIKPVKNIPAGLEGNQITLTTALEKTHSDLRREIDKIAKQDEDIGISDVNYVRDLVKYEKNTLIPAYREIVKKRRNVMDTSRYNSSFMNFEMLESALYGLDHALGEASNYLTGNTKKPKSKLGKVLKNISTSIKSYGLKDESFRSKIMPATIYVMELERYSYGKDGLVHFGYNDLTPFSLKERSKVSNVIKKMPKKEKPWTEAIAHDLYMLKEDYRQKWSNVRKAVKSLVPVIEPSPQPAYAELYDKY